MNAFPLFGHPPARSVRWWTFDVLVTVLVALFSFPYLHQENVTPSPLAILVVVALTVPLIVRRIWPSAVFGWLFGVSAAVGLWNVRLVVSFALVVALYTIAAYQPRRRALVAAGLLEGGVIAAVIRLAGSSWWHGAILGTGMVAAALGLGLYSATRRAYLKELHDRAERLERERDQQQELAAAAERARITREMHDIVAHHLAVMIALSDGAAAASAGSSPRAATAMRTVSATGRQALADTRRLLSGPAPMTSRTASGNRCRTSANSTPWSRAYAPPACRSAMNCRALPDRCPPGSADRLPAGPGGAHQHPQARRGRRQRGRAPAVPARRGAPGHRRRRRRRKRPPAGNRRARAGGHAAASADLRRRGTGRPRSPAGWRVSARLRLDQEMPA